MLFPMLTAEWLHLVLYCIYTECYYYRQNIIILYWRYFDDIRSEAWLNLSWEYINGKLFAVCHSRLYMYFLASGFTPLNAS
jgi:hypothetical protein